MAGRADDGIIDGVTKAPGRRVLFATEEPPRGARPAETADADAVTDLAHHWLPDFCTWPVLFALMVVAELVALVIVLAPSDASVPTWQQLGVASLTVQWLAVLWTVCLCKSRPLLLKLAPWMAEFAAYGLMLATTALASWLLFSFDRALSLGFTGPEQSMARFVLRNSVICALVAAAVLRYFYVQEQWRERVRAEARARYQALQARIRPHFLFNSMNTIASLIRTRPAQAETAVEDLADLFRAALSKGDGRHTLGEELDLARGYLRIEELRLGARLTVRWDVDELPRDMVLPALLLQPLVENAVYHGVQPLEDGGAVRVVGRRVPGAIEIVVENPLPAASRRAPRGNGVALANIRGRIAYHFESRGALVVDEKTEAFVCTLRLPYD
jgi:two-component system sensor histidine kinase AlgZ